LIELGANGPKYRSPDSSFEAKLFRTLQFRLGCEADRESMDATFRVTKGTLEGRFVELLSELQPEPGYIRLFNGIVLDVWKDRQNGAERLRRDLESFVRRKRERLDHVDETFLHERSIDRQTYERQRDQLREQVALAEIELNDAVLSQLDIEGVLAFAEHVMTNAARLWMELALGQKQQLQKALFPNGLHFDGERFGTAVTCLAFKKLGGNGGAESEVASPGGCARVGAPETFIEGRLAA
jgi:hypothetical protein